MATAEHVSRRKGRKARRAGASVGAALLAAATVVPTAVQPVSPEVKLAADSTALLVCGVTCPKLHDAGVAAVMDSFVTPTHPGRTFTPIAVAARGEAWPLTGIFRVLGLLLGDPSLFGPGGPAWPDEPLWKLSGLFDLTGDQSIEAGADAIEAAMAPHVDGSVVVYGLSQGAASANVVKGRLSKKYPEGTAAPDIDFIVHGDVNTPNGGLHARFPGLYIPIIDWTFNGPAPTDTPFDTVVIASQYDGFADFPLYPVNLLATLNAIMGILYVHTWPFEVALPEDPTSSPAFQGTFGDSSYYFFETQNLPLFSPLRMLGVPEALIDVVEPFVRVLVELGYDRSIPLWEPTPARLFPRVDLATLLADLGEAIAEGIDNALALVGLPPLPKSSAPVGDADPPVAITTAVVDSTGLPLAATDSVSSGVEQDATQTAESSFPALSSEGLPEGEEPGTEPTEGAVETQLVEQVASDVTEAPAIDSTDTDPTAYEGSSSAAWPAEGESAESGTAADNSFSDDAPLSEGDAPSSGAALSEAGSSAAGSSEEGSSDDESSRGGTNSDVGDVSGDPD
ncbi:MULTISPECIES: PE-PPE domain-containing protein [Mycobacteriaceae]|uniref:PE-PPE domain-containing protein n=1 Tax=Mycolicibacterium parafortuitum TaxID=39692 RepID=A0ACC6MLY8_MYCPF|nr:MULTISPECIES: PE-PPE domain-containing protein [Mycobacteriaceae]MDZ5087940.1 PE-PPE domain-containing protein [Mycolicibacterium parafortuitum]